MGSSNGTQRKSLWWTMGVIFLPAVVLNYLWEMAQMQFYVGANSPGAAWSCLLASLGDGLLVLLIYIVGRVVFGHVGWFRRLGWRGYGLVLCTGLVLSLLIELAAVHLTNRWAYAPRMPLVPVLKVGLLPVAQMLVLPPLIFRATAAWLGRGEE